MTQKFVHLLAWSFIILINFYFIYTFPLRYFNNKTWSAAFGPLLIAHISFGIIAILIGPLQFFPSFRQKYLHLHRFSGRIYLLSILGGALAAIVLAIGDAIVVHHRLIFGTGILGLAFAWLLTSGMALWAIKNRNFTQHREWMIKSYVVTCGFTIYRIFAVSLNNFFHVDYEKDMSGIMAWACWSVPLLLTEVILQANKIKHRV